MIHQVDTPPYEIDAGVLERFDQRQTIFGRVERDSEAIFYQQGVHQNAERLIAEGQPGFSRLEFARLRAAWTVYDHFRGAFSWDRLGGEGSPAGGPGAIEVPDRAWMSAQVKETALAYGAVKAGICELDRRWVYARDMAGERVAIPPEFRYAIAIAVPMDAAAIQSSPSWTAGTATGVGYSRMAFCISCLAEFIRHLGYHAIPMGNDTALSIPLAIDAGLGELGRNGLLITPEYGSCVRLCKVFTDLPLLPDRPIAFGVTELCRTCRACADACEVDAIQHDPEPSFRLACRSNNAGIQRWAVNHDRCYAFWVENGASCSTCIAACPLTNRALRA